MRSPRSRLPWRSRSETFQTVQGSCPAPSHNLARKRSENVSRESVPDWDNLVTTFGAANGTELIQCRHQRIGSESRIDWLALQRQHPKHAFMHAPQRLLPDEPFQRLDAQGKLP